MEQIPGWEGGDSCWRPEKLVLAISTIRNISALGGKRQGVGLPLQNLVIETPKSASGGLH